jgi:hypothetical protein
MKKMNIQFLVAVLTVLALPTVVDAQMLQDTKVNVMNTSVRKEGKDVLLDLDMDLSNLHLPANRGLVFTPMFINPADTLKLPAAEIMGKDRYIYYQRTRQTATPDPALVVRRRNGKRQTVHYSYVVPFKNWMCQSELTMGEGLCGCTQTLLSSRPLQSLRSLAFAPEAWNFRYAYIQPGEEDVKRRMQAGSARLNFAVSSSVVVPGYENNPVELGKIRRTIEAIQDDPDMKITGITLHGYASPDGAYHRNLVLSRRRTQALVSWLCRQYHFPKDLFQVDWTAEDWQGVREYVDRGTLPQWEEVLSVIDSRRAPDDKEGYLKKCYPRSYRILVDSVYPALRRTDYTVNYSIRKFNLEEARSIVRTHPQKLSLIEMYRVAQSYHPGSEDFNQVFDVAVRMYPDSKLANLNAANAALSHGDTVSAERFLSRTGDSPEAENARGILAVRKGDAEKAKYYFKKSAAAGLDAAGYNLQELLKNQ